MNNAAAKLTQNISEQNVVTWERVVPDKLDTSVSFQKKILEQHLERYRFASRFVRDKIVIDAACGTGYGSEIIKNAGAKQVIGIDVDVSTVSYAQNRYGKQGISFLIQDLNTYDFQTWTDAASRVDIFVSFETVEHLERPADYLKRVSSILTKDGLLIASVPIVPTVDIDEFHKHDFTKKSWRKLVESSGFEIIDELLQEYTASIKELVEEDKATNTTSGARRNLRVYYLRHPIRFITRYIRLMLFGLELDMLTVVCRKKL